MRRLEPESSKQYLGQLLDHALKHIPYYQDLGIEPKDDPYETLKSFPLLDKPAIRKAGERLYSPDHKTQRTLLNSSGGSTGEPINILQDESFLSSSASGELWFYKNLIGVDRVEARKLYIWGSERDVFRGKTPWKRRFVYWLGRQHLINSFDLNQETMRKCIELNNRHRPDVIKAYAGSIYEVAKFAQKRKLEVLPPGAIHSAAEQLQDYMRTTIESVFGCKVHDYYGSREVGSLAGECRSGLMHEFHWVNHIELLDDAGNEVKEGQDGEVVVTGLHNFVMPMIRYRIGDRAIRGPECSCGFPGPTLAKILGRVSNSFSTREGGTVHGEFFTHLFYYREDIEQFQVIQKDLDRIEIRYVPREGADIATADRTDIENKINVAMGACQVSWQKESTIEKTPQGKHLFTISEVNRN